MKYFNFNPFTDTITDGIAVLRVILNELYGKWMHSDIFLYFHYQLKILSKNVWQYFIMNDID